jgi:hypothetical protein
MNKKDRENLAKIIEADGGTNWWQPVEFEAKIRSQLPTELKIVSVPPNPSSNFNCFVYALNLENDSEFLGGQNPIQKEFIRHLLNNGLLKIAEHPEKGTLVFYEDDSDIITHAGIMQSKADVLSKWMWGALFAHKLWDVPSSFGNKVFYCPPISRKTAKEVYFAYRNSGVEIKPIT